MTDKYYIVVDGLQAGPFDKETLISQGLTLTSLVWRQGMADWQQASEVDDLRDLLFMPPPVPEEVPTETPLPYNPFNPNNSGEGCPIPHKNWMAWAIVGTVLGVLSGLIGTIFGVLAVVKASEADTYYSTGNLRMGDTTNSQAKTFTIVSIVIGLLSLLAAAGIIILAIAEVI